MTGPLPGHILKVNDFLPTVLFVYGDLSLITVIEMLTRTKLILRTLNRAAVKPGRDPYFLKPRPRKVSIVKFRASQPGGYNCEF